MANWSKIKREYISGGTSYRKLCEKYDVPLATLKRKAKAESWVELKAQCEAKATTKTIDTLSNREADRAARLVSVADKLLNQVESMVEGSSEPPTAKDIRSLTRALLDIKELQDIRSDLDTKEQEARIANLRRQAEKEELAKEPVQVIMDAELNEFSE